MSFLQTNDAQKSRRTQLETQGGAMQIERGQKRQILIEERLESAATLEEVQDMLGGADFLLVSGLTKSYNDAADTLTLALETEAVQDIVGAMIIAGNGVIVTYDDALGQIKISPNRTVRTIAASGNAANTDYLIRVTAGTLGVTVTLPDATLAINANLELVIKKIDAGMGVVTIDGFGTQTIDGTATRTLMAQFERVRILNTGANWEVI